MEVMQRVILYIIPVIALIISLMFYYSPDSGFDKLEVAVNSLKEYAPDINLGAEEITSEEAKISIEHQRAIRGLAREIRNMLNPSVPNNCFSNYGGFPDLLSYGTSLRFSSQGGRTTLFVYGGTDGRKLITDLSEEFEGMVPCVIAGSDSVTQNFFAKFIDKNPVTSGYFNPVDKVTILYDEEVSDQGKSFGPSQDRLFGLECSNGNRIMTGPESDEGPNRYCNNFEDGGMLFTPDNKHICFFPTNWVDNHDQHGIDNDYVSGNLVNQFNSGLLTKCTQT
jgi:hypothetical protein